MASTRDIESGLMRHWITIQQATRAADASGQLIDTWADLVTVPAALDVQAASETFRAEGQQLQSKRTTVFRTRWRDSITSKDRVSFDSRTFNIVSAVDPDGRRVELRLTCVEDAD